MNFKKGFFILVVFLVFVSLIGVYSTFNIENTVDTQSIPQNNNSTDSFGCCSIVLQLEGNDTLFSYRRDSDIDADIYIEQVDWHGIPAIKQYKNNSGYFCHVIITNDGWVIGIGGIDDGVNSELVENITATMVNDNNTISESALAQIQELKKPYGKGHVVIKAPDGSYGFATVNMLKTGKLEPGQYISIPNDYQYSRGKNISLDNPDNIQVMSGLSQSDLYGLDRREIIIYDININENNNTTNIYVSNEDGAYVGVNNSVYIDDIYFNNTVIKGEDIPLAPNYTSVGSVTFTNEDNQFGKLIYWIILISFIFFVAILYFIVLKFVRFIKSKIRRKNY